MITSNIFFCGLGGQGVLTVAEICGRAAMYGGYHVKKSEVHGMSQRGGSVESHVRFGKVVHSPLIKTGEAAYLVSTEPGEGVRLQYFLHPTGKSLVPFLAEAYRLIKNPLLVNSWLLGVLSCHLPISVDCWEAAFQITIKRLLIENLTVFENGRIAGVKSMVNGPGDSKLPMVFPQHNLKSGCKVDTTGSLVEA
jgi:indolepyruvate ferredoxin oxidoreductase, beta subunit